MLRAIAVVALMSAAELGASSHAAAQTPAAPAPSVTLPGGATSLRETFEDWQVTCSAQGNNKRCAVSQEQVGQNRQRLLAIELIPADNNTLTGTLVMPFGLLFEPGITMQVDDKPFGKPLRIRTCLPAGCIVPIQFDGALANALRAGASFKLSGIPSESTSPITFTISLKGLATGLNRVAALAK